MLKLKTISSSSKGNFHILEDENQQLILDCGLKYDDVSEYLNIDKIQGILITHKHNDHCLGAKSLSNIVKCNFYAPKETLDLIHIPDNMKQIVQLNKIIKLNNFIVMPFKVSHGLNGIACECYNYMIKHVQTNTKIAYITDTGDISNLTLKNLDFIIIEANWTQEYLEYEDITEQELLKYERLNSILGHLSIEETIDVVEKNLNINLKKIFLSHLSRFRYRKNYFAEKMLNNPKLKDLEIHELNPNTIGLQEFELVKHNDMFIDLFDD